MPRKNRAWNRAAAAGTRRGGHPPAGRREHRVRFWQAIARGASSEKAAIEAGVLPSIGVRWFRKGGGMPPLTLAPVSGRYLSFTEREEIAVRLAGGSGVREIARRLGRAPSTISRELQRNAAMDADALNIEPRPPRGMRSVELDDPSPAKLAMNAELRAYVQDQQYVGQVVPLPVTGRIIVLLDAAEQAECGVVQVPGREHLGIHGNASAGDLDGRLRLCDADAGGGWAEDGAGAAGDGVKHEDEIARPDYYSVRMDAGAGRAIRTEMTATSRCALMKFTFPANASSMVMVEASRPGVAGFAEVDAARREISGYNPDRTDRILGPFALPHFKGYFVVEFRKGFAGSDVWGSG